MEAGGNVKYEIALTGWKLIEVPTLVYSIILAIDIHKYGGTIVTMHCIGSVSRLRCLFNLWKVVIG